MEIVLATTNKHKIVEYRRLFASSGLRVLTPDEAGAVPPAVTEDGATFLANAEKKARAFAGVVHSAVLADDSGISVDALGGAPGVRSARFGSPSLDDAGRMRYLLECLRDIPPGRRGAHYTCALVLALPDGSALTSEGKLYGEIALAPSAGTTGFGYDPIFLVPGAGRIVADMRPEEKDAVSHRGMAVRRLLNRMAQCQPCGGTLEL